MSNFKMKATHATVKAYYETLERFGRGKFDNEGNVRRAFEALLEKCARSYEWMVVPEFPIPRAGRNPAKVDAAVLDAFNIPRGYWVAYGPRNLSPLKWIRCEGASATHTSVSHAISPR
jgi:hypothetical protein